MNCLVIVGCSRRKRVTSSPIPALDLYCGGGIPAIREYIASHPEMSQSIYIISAKYGIIPGSDLIETYESLLTPQRAQELTAEVSTRVSELLLHRGRLDRIFILAEPLYFGLLTGASLGSLGSKLCWEQDIRMGVARFIEKIENWRLTQNEH